jgi:hypothetical protein
LRCVPLASYAAAREGNFEAARDNLLRTLAWRVEGVPSHKRLGYDRVHNERVPPCSIYFSIEEDQRVGWFWGNIP